MKILKDAKKECKDREDLIAKQTTEYNAKLEELLKRDKQTETWPPPSKTMHPRRRLQMRATFPLSSWQTK